MDYINTSHPSFIGGSKALEMALQDNKSSRIVAATIPRNKVYLCCYWMLRELQLLNLYPHLAPPPNKKIKMKFW